jgi:hypothetical protein
MRPLQTFGLAIALGIFLAPAARAGTYLEHEKVFPNPVTLKSMTAKVRTWRDGDMMRREDPLTGNILILDLKKGQIKGYSKRDRTYWVVDEKAFRATVNQSLVLLGAKPLPNGDIEVPPGIFKPTGKKATIAGRKAYEVAVTAALPPGQSASYWFSEEVPSSMEEMVSDLRAALGNPSGAGFEKLFSQWRALQGYPVQQVTVIQTASGAIIHSETLLKYEKQKVDPTLFKVPAGFKKIEDPMARLSGATQSRIQPAVPGIDAPLSR